MIDIKAVIFDMDGVIIDSEPLHFECSIRTIKDFQIDLCVKDFEPFVGVSDHEMWAKLIREYKINATVEEIIEHHHNHRKELFNKENMIPVEGTIELIKHLHAKNIKIGLASSSPKFFIKSVLDNLYIGKYFQAIVSGEEFEKSKPAPDIYLKAASILEVDPKHCMAVEDARNGILSAKAAGMTVIGYQNPNSGNQDLSLADYVVGHINEVLKI